MLTSRHGAMLCITSAIFTGSLLHACVSNAQSLESGAASQAIAIVGGGGSSSDTQTLRTNPDAIAAPAMTAQFSCYVGDGSIALGSYLFGGISGTRTVLDEGCEARADAETFVGIAYARAEILGDAAGAARLINMAERRMTATREAFIAATFGGEWPETWRP